MKNKIDLSKLSSNYIDLDGYSNKVTLTGKYQGKRIVFSNHSGKVLNFIDGYIDTNHPEDAICFNGQSLNCALVFSYFRLLGGGITFWDKLVNVTVHGSDIHYPHTGIRCTGDYENSDVKITENRIRGASHEGIYMGISKDTPNKSFNIIISGNEIEESGWDGIQLGNWRNGWICNNKVTRAGQKKTFGQSHAICINPGAQAWVWNNEVIECADTYIVNAATMYLDTVPKGYQDLYY